MQIIQDGGERYCMVDGKPYITVTSLFSILEKHGLKKWKERVGEEEAVRVCNEAGDFGGAVHKGCEAVASGLPTPSSAPPDVQLAVQRFKGWFNLAVDRVELVETRVYSHELRVAGQADLLVRLKGDEDWTVVDIKTGRLNNLVALQTAGYRRLISEFLGVPIACIRRRLVIPLKRGVVGRVVVKEIPEADNGRDVEAFESLVHLWYWFKRKGGS